MLNNIDPTFLKDLSIGLLANSGPSRQPKSFGQILAASFEETDRRKREREEADYRNALLGFKIKKAQQGSAPKLPTGYMYDEQTGQAQKVPGLEDYDPLAGQGGQLQWAYNQSQNDPKFNQFLHRYQTGLRTGTQLDPQGNVQPIPGYGQAKGEISKYEKLGSEMGKTMADRQANYSKVYSGLKGFESQAKIVTDTIDKALNLANDSSFSTGWSNYLGVFPNTDARELNNYLDTIRANVGFDKLQQMRDNSPTGGALGQVSEMENKLLQAVNGALDPKQGDQLIQNLTIIKELYPKVLEERRSAFNRDYGGFGQSQETIPTGQSVMNPSTVNYSDMSDEELLNLIGK